jgi:group I intron endonuclease
MGHIYQIKNIINGAVYIGSVLSRNPLYRWQSHRKELRGNYHHSIHLQRAWNKYGEENFVFEILEHVDSDVLNREQYYLNLRKNEFPLSLNYNVCWTAGNCAGRKWSKKMKKVLSNAHIGQKLTEKSKQKQRETWESKCKIPYSIVSPEGVLYENIKNIRAFAKIHNLNPSTLSAVFRKKHKQIKGWSLPTEHIKKYKLISPTGDVFEGISLKKMCESKNLYYNALHCQCIQRKRKYKGWSVEVI